MALTFFAHFAFVNHQEAKSHGLRAIPKYRGHCQINFAKTCACVIANNPHAMLPHICLHWAKRFVITNR